MKSIYILAAVMLVFSGSVLTDDEEDRNSELELELEAIDLIQHPDSRFDSETALELMDKLCGQVGNEMEGIVSGALNVGTGEFKTWAEYTATEGLNPNEAFYFATGEWHTFRGECMLRPQSIWWEHSYKSYGSWGSNLSNRRSNRRSPVKVRFAGFTTRTSMSSWVAKCENQNVDAMVKLFRKMPGIPKEIITVWDGLERKYEEVRTVVGATYLSPGETGRVVGTTIVRVVHAVQVFRVDEWYWYYDNQDRGFDTTWERLGLSWKQVYTDLAFVEARGLCQQFPKDRTHVRGARTSHDPCVNLDNKEIESLDEPVSPAGLEAAITRVEL
jgi:hypothetical protein